MIACCLYRPGKLVKPNVIINLLGNNPRIHTGIRLAQSHVMLTAIGTAGVLLRFSMFLAISNIRSTGLWTLNGSLRKTPDLNDIDRA